MDLAYLYALSLPPALSLYLSLSHPFVASFLFIHLSLSKDGL